MKCSLLVLSSYLDGELEARRQGELEAHLVGCQRCRSGLGYLSEEVERVSGLGRVSVADHSVEQLLVQLGLAEPDPEEATAFWPEAAHAAPGVHHAEAAEPIHDENRVDMTGSPLHGSFWEPPELTPPELAPSVPHAAVPPAPPPATAAPPPTPARQWPPPDAPELAPIAPPSAGAFPPGGPEPSEPSDHVTASGGDAEMTASPPWTPSEAPETLYPLTDEDVLEEPVPVERFGVPPVQARPSFFERLRDRIAVRRALSRSTDDYDDSVQIVSGSGAPLRTGRARAEVGRRRQEAMHMASAPSSGDDLDAMEASDPGDEVDLGPLPPTAPFVAPGSTQMPRPGVMGPAPLPSASGLPGQLALPGTDEHPARQVMGTPLPPHRHTLESAIGAPPPMAPHPPASVPPPAPPTPDLLAEALSEYERARPGGTPFTEPRPWRPREIPEDLVPAAPVEPPEPRAERAAPGERSRRSPSQIRESRRLLAIFGAATLVMLIVGLVSGRTSTPLTSSTATSQSSSQSHPVQNQPAAKAPAAPAQSSTAPRASAPAPVAPVPAGTPQLTGVKILGDTGSGYQVKDFRYGEHPNDFRIVLDLDPAGNATGTPKATIGFLDSTTLLVSVEGVVPAGSTGSLPPGSPVTAVTQLNPSPFPNAVTYQLKLSHAMTFSAGYLAGPLRLVLDLAG